MIAIRKGEGLNMLDKPLEWLALLAYALAAISGGLGGCAIAGHHLLRGQSIRLSYVLAYGIVGMAFGILVLAYGSVFGVAPNSIDSLIGQSLLAGAAGSLTLASTNLSARWVLKRLGIEVFVNVRRTGKRRDGERSDADG